MTESTRSTARADASATATLHAGLLSKGKEDMGNITSAAAIRLLVVGALVLFSVASVHRRNADQVGRFG
jgi:hypothetical protein